MAERYAEGKCCMHVHLRLGIVGDHAIPNYWCAVFERAVVGLNVNDSTSPDLPAGGRQSGAHEVKTTVLVGDVQVMDDPERFALASTTVRLQPLRLCEHLWTDTGKFARVVCIPLPSILEDWELGVRQAWLIDSDQFKGRVVKGASEVVDALPNEGRPLLDRGSFLDLDPPYEVVRFMRVYLLDHSIRVTLLDEAIMLGAQLAEVFLCPQELHSGPAKLLSRSHGANDITEQRSRTSCRPVFRQTLLGDAPWQADYDRLRAVARAALASSRDEQEQT